MKKALLAVCGAAMALVPMTASASAPSFDDSRELRMAYSDDPLGSATSTASASTATGELNVSASTRQAAPVGFVTASTYGSRGAGRSEALGAANLYRSFPAGSLSPGTHTVTATFQLATGSFAPAASVSSLASDCGAELTVGPVKPRRCGLAVVQLGFAVAQGCAGKNCFAGNLVVQKRKGLACAGEVAWHDVAWNSTVCSDVVTDPTFTLSGTFDVAAGKEYALIVALSTSTYTHGGGTLAVPATASGRGGFAVTDVTVT